MMHDQNCLDPLLERLCHFDDVRRLNTMISTLFTVLVRIHFIIVMIRWTGLAPWEFEFPTP